MDVPPLSSTALPISASSLIATLHQTFTNSQYKSLRIDSTSAIVLSPNVEESFVAGLWDHAYRREEDQALLVMPSHPAASTAFFSALSAFPNIDSAVLQALNVLSPFLNALTPQNLSTRFHNGLAVVLSLNSKGAIVSSRIQLSDQPFTSLDQLLNLPAKESNRVFDVFYHLLFSESSEIRGTYLSLKSSPDQYDLLRKSQTYNLPEWVNFSDDYALAKDWSDALRQCGFKGSSLRGLLSTLSGILLLGNKRDANDVAEGASLIGIDPSIQSKYSANELIVSAYTALVKNVLSQLNTFLSKYDAPATQENDVTSAVTIVECADQHRYTMLKNVFDNSIGINAEMRDDGLNLTKPPASVTRTLQKLASTPNTSSLSSNIAVIPDFDGLLDSSLSYLSTKAKHGKVVVDDPLNVATLTSSNRIWSILNIAASGTASELSEDRWSSSLVSAQMREFYVTEWAQKRRQVDFTADFEFYEFLERYSTGLPPNMTVYNLEQWARNDRRWDQSQFMLGKSRLWISEPVWQELEMTMGGFDATAASPFVPRSAESFAQIYQDPEYPHSANYGHGPAEHLLPPGNSPQRYDSPDVYSTKEEMVPRNYIDEGDEFAPDINAEMNAAIKEEQKIDPEIGKGSPLQIKEVKKMPLERKIWVTVVWALTFWIPSPFLKYIMRMRRSEMRMAFREKLVLFFFIFLLNAGIIFYMIFLGRLICPDYSKVWNAKEVGTHQGTDDFFVSIHGSVYDITKFYKINHSDSQSRPVNPGLMLNFAGQDVSDYFPPPLTIACPALVKDDSVSLSYNTTKSPFGTIATHQSGSVLVADTNTALHQFSWYDDVFKPNIQNYYKGRLVTTRSDLLKDATANNLFTVIINNEIYDLTNYFTTTAAHPANSNPVTQLWSFFDARFVEMVQNSQGGDITSQFNDMDEFTRQNTLQCLNNAFLAGEVDFRNSARCQVANIVLLVIAAILTSVTLVKFLASLRFGSKRLPSPQDKFVVCQIPIYTESEDDFRLAIDSLTKLKYDNRRKLLVMVCDGLIVGAGNDKRTPDILLEMLGVDEKIDPPALPYESISDGNRLNYAKIYSGLYEYEGNVVPYLVVVKVGRPDEQNSGRAGNRGKRDSQILMMRFFNHVHYQKPMSPVELEIFHHMTNIIGVDPELYEYMFMVDADTSVSEDSLTRLVSACTSDSRIAGICGETGLQNEDHSWTTMIQVYEYFISHHLTKAFESLFGSVTCLPGCFSLYRMRTAKKFKPLIISNEVIKEYAIVDVDTLHKKNLFSLGEDRYLTTLMQKNFSKMKYTFIADAYCQTAVPEDFSVLLSQRRRWINSTIHNLLELMRLDNMCGFCFLGMRIVVFIDLVGTVMLPSVVVYLGYLIYVIASHNSPLPLISIILIGAVYGLQALVFILHRQWQHIGWMLIYLAAYPIHSFLLPIYSFWNMDNFSWGSTRKVEMKGMQAKAVRREDVWDPKSVPTEMWSEYATRNNLPGSERRITFDARKGRVLNDVQYTDYGYDMQDLSSIRKPAPGVEGDRLSRPFSQFSLDINRVGTPLSGVGRGIPADVRSSHMSLAPTEALEENPFDEVREGQVRETIRTVLRDADLDNMTKRQLRQKVEDILGVEFVGGKIAIVDRLIDEELENLEDE